MKQDQTFNERCYELLRQIPQGKVTTYAEMARALGSKAWRAVGTAMAKNQAPKRVPITSSFPKKTTRASLIIIA